MADDLIPNGTVTNDLYESVSPLAEDDAANGNALKIIVASLAGMSQEIDTLARDGSRPGWSNLMDIVTTPLKAIDWLGQFVGVRPIDSLTEAQMRANVTAKTGFARGSVSAMRAAAQLYLTGTKTVNFFERDTSPYHVTINTYTSETPSSANVLAALLSQKPAGVQLAYNTTIGQTYQQLKTNHPLYSQVKSFYATYNHVRNDVP